MSGRWDDDAGAGIERILGAGDPAQRRDQPDSTPPNQDIRRYDLDPRLKGMWVAWKGHPGCQLCQDNEWAGVIRYGDLFPSGVNMPPAHDHCGCTLLFYNSPEEYHNSDNQSDANTIVF